MQLLNKNTHAASPSEPFICRSGSCEASDQVGSALTALTVSCSAFSPNPNLSIWDFWDDVKVLKCAKYFKYIPFKTHLPTIPTLRQTNIAMEHGPLLHWFSMIYSTHKKKKKTERHAWGPPFSTFVEIQWIVNMHSQVTIKCAHNFLGIQSEGIMLSRWWCFTWIHISLQILHISLKGIWEILTFLWISIGASL